MEWHQLKYFQTLARIQHYSKAAEQAAISQPALSRSIAKLEAELEVPLFERIGRNIKLTKYGEIFLHRVENALKEIEIGKQELQDFTDPEYGHLSIAFVQSDFVVGLIHSFQTEYPHIDYRLTQTGSNGIIRMLQSGEADIGFVSLIPIEDKLINVEPVYKEELFIVVSRNHALAKYDQLDLKSLKDEHFVTYKAGYGLRTLMDTFCEQAGFTPRVIFEGEELSSILACVSTGFGITLTPDLHSLDKTTFKLIKVIQPYCMRTIGIAWKENSYLSPAAKKFISFIPS
ncbi:LysR family transcriptional regulator [Priestia aryabhattai]|uniref:HTH-type transcriptional regulator GltC n=1 Tax=Priestia megaterium Q3 TaxID=1452722 RepID=A0A806TJP9_PRIMG|nr:MULTISPECIES: LysR family transcriptional regulator [Priestia]NHH96055.1 HTH-type transcriptional regulator GltC [Bacillus sp. MB95]AKP78590.1 HTH-type transcriptional regulator GltC [Priestia megaterium Q3]MEB4868357.1 LysR family transcriptional regulator [Priestia megaterium]MED3923003.1 LysR family transcriptional regulator [Priestia aryabhattai]MED4002659.1 LysR family transcriptional regulator [Priestia aryabhattai]